MLIYTGIALNSEDYHKENAAISSNNGVKYETGSKLNAASAVDAADYHDEEAINQVEASDLDAVSAAVSYLLLYIPYIILLYIPYIHYCIYPILPDNYYCIYPIFPDKCTYSTVHTKYVVGITFKNCACLHKLKVYVHGCTVSCLRLYSVWSKR